MEPYVSAIQRVECLGGGALRIAFNNSVLETRHVTLPDNGSGFVPTSFACRSGMVHLTEGGATIRMASSRGELELSAAGVRFPGSGTDLAPYTPEAVHRIARLLVTDTQIQSSLFQLHRDLTFVTFECAAATGTVPVQAVAAQALNTAERSLDVLTGGATVCTIEQIIEKATQEIWGWVDHVVHAAERFAQCVEACPRFVDDPFGSAACAAACVAAGFVDLVSRTFEFIKNITYDIVVEVTHCVTTFPANVGKFSTPYGSVDAGRFVDPQVYTAGEAGVVPADPQTQDPAVLGNLFASFSPLLSCIASGDWSIEKLDLGFDVFGTREIPYGVRVCIDKACVDKILATLSFTWARDFAGLLTSLFTSKGVAGVVTGFAKIPALQAALAKAAAITGLAVEVMAGALIAFTIELAYQNLAIIGQIRVREFFGQSFANGACFHHPSFVIAGIGVLASPLAAIALGLNTPIIVTPA